MDIVVLNGDVVSCIPIFGTAIVVVRPGNIKGSGTLKVGGKKACIEGDEKKVKIPACAYISPPYIIPGMGDITITLKPNQIAKKTKNKNNIILKGIMFDAKFTITKPAQELPPPAGGGTPDAKPFYQGQGQFIAPQLILKAT